MQGRHRGDVRVLCVVALAAVVCANTIANAADATQGTTAEQVAQLDLPQPTELEVAILPFWDYAFKQAHIEDCRGALLSLFLAEGFRVAHPALVGAVVSHDTGLEPGAAMRREDAIRLGTRVGADWAVYGIITQLEAYYKESLFGPRTRKVRVSMQLNVVDLATGETIFWQQRRDITGGHQGSAGLFGKRKASLERDALMICSNRILQPLFAALPAHEKVKPDPTAYPYLDQEESQRAYEAAPTDLAIALTYGQALLCAGLGTDAEAILKDLVQAHDDNAEAHFWHGAALLATGLQDEAVSEWQAALEKDPDNELASQQLEAAAGAGQPEGGGQ
ncbi:MAG TPA: hypothetical protein VM283_01580 [Armatimonadota bacterium]|nr:hypothetical protein [Armatimonadota bacterium]